MRISHEAIYQALFVQGRGALRRELTACLRTGRVLRMPRARTRGRGKAFISPEIMISQRPAEAADRAVPGHWEGDLILGLGSSAIGTLVERTTRFTLLLHLPRMAGHGHEARVKNGPALAGHGAEAVRDAITRTIITLPEQLRRSLTWDQGAEMAQHARLKIDAGVQVYFCDPHSPWQRGTNENTNGLLRQYFPKGTDLSMHSAEEIAAVAAALNSRPRKTLDWKTPAEALDRFASIGRQRSCCDDHLNPPNTSQSNTPSAWPRPASSLPSAASATATTMPRRNHQRSLQGRGHPPTRTMASMRGRRVRHARMGGLVQQSTASGAHRQHPAGRSRGTLLRHTERQSIAA